MSMATRTGRRRRRERVFESATWTALSSGRSANSVKLALFMRSGGRRLERVAELPAVAQHVATPRRHAAAAGSTCDGASWHTWRSMCTYLSLGLAGPITSGRGQLVASGGLHYRPKNGCSASRSIYVKRSVNLALHRRFPAVGSIACIRTSSAGFSAENSLLHPVPVLPPPQQKQRDNRCNAPLLILNRKSALARRTQPPDFLPLFRHSCPLAVDPPFFISFALQSTSSTVSSGGGGVVQGQ